MKSEATDRGILHNVKPVRSLASEDKSGAELRMVPLPQTGLPTFVVSDLVFVLCDCLRVEAVVHLKRA